MRKNKIKDKRPPALKDEHMPKDFSISLNSYGGGGTTKSLNPKPKKLKYQSMKGLKLNIKILSIIL